MKLAGCFPPMAVRAPYFTLADFPLDSSPRQPRDPVADIEFLDTLDVIEVQYKDILFTTVCAALSVQELSQIPAVKFCVTLLIRITPVIMLCLVR
ncbi:MAG TPA: hypothetical protein VFO29_05110 [Candidatus Rubrimentiphilum sp.]|nr:hypothetical protein [Candidatus Rubrimentiphilum sp.]